MTYPGNVLIATVVERRGALHPERHGAVQALDLADQPREEDLAAAIAPGHEVRDGADGTLGQKLGDENVAVRRIVLLGLERGDGADEKVAALVGIDYAGEDTRVSGAGAGWTYLGESKFGMHIDSMLPERLTHAAVCHQQCMLVATYMEVTNEGVVLVVSKNLSSAPPLLTWIPNTGSPASSTILGICDAELVFSSLRSSPSSSARRFLAELGIFRWMEVWIQEKR